MQNQYIYVVFIVLILLNNVQFHVYIPDIENAMYISII